MTNTPDNRCSQVDHHNRVIMVVVVAAAAVELKVDVTTI